MADDKSISPQQIERATLALGQAIELVDVLRTLAADIVTETGDEGTAHKAVAIRELAGNAGYLLQSTCEGLGENSYSREVGDWIGGAYVAAASVATQEH